MARKRRTDLVHPFLHVYTRGADRQDIFSSDRDRSVFEELLADTVGRFDLVLHAYAFMHNHVHTFIDRREADISAAMRQLLGRYARYYNTRTDRTGPLFTSRFSAVEVVSDEQALQLSRYIHLNPLEFVERSAITAYRWSSLAVYAGRRPRPEWLTTGFVDRIFHRESSSYVRYVLAPQPRDDHHGRPTRPWEVFDLAALGDVVNDVVQIPASRRGEPRVQRLLRQLAVTAAVQLRVATAADISRFHGLGSASTARSTARRGRVRSKDDPGFAAMLDRVEAEVFRRTADHHERAPGATI